MIGPEGSNAAGRPDATVREALADATRRLAAAGIETPARDARRLMEHLAGGPVFGGDPLPDPAAWTRLVAARAARRPVAQILGRRAFWTHEFEVNGDTLDPRPETEALVAAALEVPWDRVLDLGTGTGCILLSLLAERPAAAGLGTDLSAPALAVARRNATRLGLDGRAAFAQADWLDGIDGPFDLIVSNPPYIAEAEMAALAPELRDWEPRMALTPGGDGLAAYRILARDAPARLSAGGHLMVEVGAAQGRAVAALLRGAGFGSVAIRPDLDGRDRIVSGRKGA
jgi:release factor glutamine methyltransferase